MKLLVVGDEHKNRRLLAVGLGDESMEYTIVTSPNDMNQLFSLRDFHVVLLDWEMKTSSGPELLGILRQRAPSLPVVATTANALAAAEARGLGAAECLIKPYDIAKLNSILCEQAKRRQPDADQEPAAAKTAAAEPVSVSAVQESVLKGMSFKSQSPLVQRVLETAWRVAPTSATVLLLGENGTGKTVLAHAIHERSTRSEKPFVTVNCPCLKRELLESELFGHVKGSFTGAIQDTQGKVAAAEGGTLFLDEVGEMPLDIQPKLLRLLQERTYERVGEPRPRMANVRVIAATNRDLAAEVKAGRFREDLYYRLNVISLRVAPLRERREDILETAQSFLETVSAELKRKLGGFTPLAIEALQAYHWPGNLRELRNAVERAAILCDGDMLDVDDFPTVRPTRYAHPQVGEFVSLETIAEEHIRQVVERTPTFEHAARILGINKSTLYRKRKRSQPNISAFPPEDGDEVACAS
jgi:NtrC-family two-component system response regulator AlgB